MIIVGTRPEIIRLAAVIKKCRTYFDTILAHTGQNYDYNLNGIFFRDRNYSVLLRNPQFLHKVEKWKRAEKNQRNVNIQEAKKVVC